VPRSRSSPAPWLASSESAPARAGVIGQRRGGVPTCRRGNLSCQDSLEVCLVQEMAVRQVPLGLLGQALREPKGLCSHPAGHLDAWLGFAAERGGPGVTRLLVLLAVAAWGFMHASGGPRDDHRRCPRFHRPRPGRACRGAEPRGALRAHLRPVSACLAVPVFALFAAGISVSPGALASAAGDPAAHGVALGLVVGKPVGIMLATVLLVRLTKASLDPSVTWSDLFAVAVVAGIGFTVSLLIGELSFDPGSPHRETVKAVVLLGSATAARVPCWSRSAAPRRIPRPTRHGSVAVPSAGQPPAPRCRGDGRLPRQRAVHPGLLDRAHPAEGPRAGARARRCEHPPGRRGALGAGQRVTRVPGLAPVVERATLRTSILVQQH